MNTLGVPMTDTSEGNKFCFSFLENKGTAITKILGIYIATQECEPVQYRIRSGVNGVNRTGIVQPGGINRELYANPPIVDMIPITSNNFTGIIVETVNSSQKISVICFSDSGGSSDGFTAVPIFNVSSIVQNYSYSVFTGGETSGTSAQAAIVAWDRIETGGVVLQFCHLSNQTFFTFPSKYFTGEISSCTKLSAIAFEEHYTPVISTAANIMSGLTATSTQPIGFMTGHECAKIPDNKEGCDHLIEQIPPSYTWGYNFLIAPFHSRDFGYIIKILPTHDSNTDFKVFCVNDSDGTVDVSVQNYVLEERLAENKGIFDITSQSYCTIQSNKPIAVMQFAKGHEVDDPYVDSPSTKTDGLGDPAMVWIPSVAQYLNKYLISNEVNLTGRNFTSNGIYVTVLPQCLNASGILDNGAPLEADVSKWSTFYCDNITDVCGYGVSIDIVQGPHLLVHTDTTCSFSAVLFGWGGQKGYAYTAGFGMRPIAGEIEYMYL